MKGRMFIFDTFINISTAFSDFVLFFTHLATFVNIRLLYLLLSIVLQIINNTISNHHKIVIFPIYI